MGKGAYWRDCLGYSHGLSYANMITEISIFKPGKLYRVKKGYNIDLMVDNTMTIRTYDHMEILLFVDTVPYSAWANSTIKSSPVLKYRFLYEDRLVSCSMYAAENLEEFND